MSLTRRFAGLLALSALLGCDRTPNELLVQNSGTQTVVVNVDYTRSEDGFGQYGSRRRHHSAFEADPGQIKVGEYRSGIRDMDVVISRKSDGLVLFSDSFDERDFDRDHGRIEITVFP